MKIQDTFTRCEMSQYNHDMPNKITIGKTAAVSVTVDERNTARGVGSGSLDVFATPMMVALMECAACEALSGTLEPGQTSVGTEINISHSAASPLGAVVTATATVTGVNGRKIEFEVNARDEAREIGNGTHARAVVDEVKFMAKLSKK